MIRSRAEIATWLKWLTYIGMKLIWQLCALCLRCDVVAIQFEVKLILIKKNQILLFSSLLFIHYLSFTVSAKCFNWHRYGDKTPKSISARIFSVIWILFGLIGMAIFTGNVTSALTALSLENGPGSLSGLKVKIKCKAIKSSPYKPKDTRINACWIFHPYCLYTYFYIGVDNVLEFWAK